MSQAVEATFKKLQKDHGQMRAFVQDLGKPSAEAPKLSYRQQLQRKRSIENLRERPLANISQARMDIVKSATP